MNTEKNSSQKTYWFIKKGTSGRGFGAMVGYPNTPQGFLFWGAVLLTLSILPKWVDQQVETKGLGIIVFFSIIILIWFPITAIKTKYMSDDKSNT